MTGESKMKVDSTMRSILSILAFSIVSFAHAAPVARSAACSALFLDGVPPEVTKLSLRANTQEICYSHFAVLHSGVARTPLWSAERLTRENVAAAHDMTREDVFHPESSLPPQDRAELADYRGSGYDRGHMAPSGDMPDSASQEESFSLANMIPQDPDNNRRLWAGIEKAVRGLASRSGEAYVITGPIFKGNALSTLHGRVLVPTSVYKAVFVPATGQAGAYVAANAAGNNWRRVSLSDLEALSGIAAFPLLNGAVRSSSPEFLPSPMMRGGHGGSAEGDAASGVHASAHDETLDNGAGMDARAAAKKIGGTLKAAIGESGVDGVRDAIKSWTTKALRKGLDRLNNNQEEQTR